MVPKPVKAVLLLFPITKTLEEKRRQEDNEIQATQAANSDSQSSFKVKSSISGESRSVIWFKQTVGLPIYTRTHKITVNTEYPLSCRSPMPVGRLDYCMHWLMYVGFCSIFLPSIVCDMWSSQTGIRYESDHPCHLNRWGVDRGYIHQWSITINSMTHFSLLADRREVYRIKPIG